MDLTKALAELRRVKDFLGAISLTEETLLKIAEVTDQINSLGKQRTILEGEVSRLNADLAIARKAHGTAIAGLNGEIGKAKEALADVRKEISVQVKSFREVEAEHLNQMAAAKREHAVLLASLKKERDEEQLKLEEIRGTVKKIAGLAG